MKIQTFLTFFQMQNLQLTEAQKSTMRDQLAQGDYFDKVGARIVELLLDDEIPGYTKGVLALEHSNLIPYDRDNAHILPWYRATECELVELEKIAFVVTKIHLQNLQHAIDQYVHGTKTVHELKKSAEGLGACVIRFNV